MTQLSKIAFIFFIPLSAMWGLLAVFSLAPTIEAAPTAVLTVDTLVDEADGSCSDDCALRDAIALAASGDTITFAISGTINIASLGELTIDKDLTIDGGGVITVDGGSSTRIFNITGGSTTFSHLTIANGSASPTTCGPLTFACGGGIRSEAPGETITLIGSTLKNNSGYLGGGIFYFGGAVILTDTLMVENSALLGGGIYVRDGMLAMTNTRMSENAGRGAGIYMHGSAGSIINSQLVDNNGNNGNGGAMYINGGAITIEESLFDGNIASSSGGAIYTGNQASLEMSNTQVSNNQAINTAAGGVFIGGPSTIRASTFVSNTAAQEGGGLFNTSNDVTIHNSTFSGNTSYSGGGVFNNGTVVLNNSTVTGNRAVANGGGISTHNLYAGTTTLNHTLVVGNVISATSTPDDVDITSGTTNKYVSQGYNLLGALDPNITSMTNTGDQVSINDAKLGPLMDNGGSTPTHALLEDSPAVNAGAPSGCQPVDQRGVPRPQGAACDIGAVERDSFTLTVVVGGPAGSGSVDSFPAGISCGASCSAEFNASSSITLTAAPAAEYFIAGWSGLCSGSQISCSFAIQQTTTITVEFAAFNKVYLPLAVR